MPCAFIDKRMLEYSTERAYCTSVALKDHPHLHQWQPVKQSAPGGAKCEYYRFRIARLFSLTNAGSQGFWATGDYRQTACHCNEGFFIFNRSFDKARLVTTNQESVEWFLRHSGDFEYEGPWKLGSAGTPYNELITL
ncbi:hypothetical protein Dda_7333 [Drechslerella dactyloides]|uniref:Uncharacterized protein n=1 Tax=Drechslerella dactyloides TaxID=74499 RepID=A0AAD6IS67_DREDA|nr:hypothetical protein Dda_7333 [Drechslerella dactyloides]